MYQYVFYYKEKKSVSSYKLYTGLILFFKVSKNATYNCVVWLHSCFRVHRFKVYMVLIYFKKHVFCCCIALNNCNFYCYESIWRKYIHVVYVWNSETNIASIGPLLLVFRSYAERHSVPLQARISMWDAPILAAYIAVRARVSHELRQLLEMDNLD